MTIYISEMVFHIVQAPTGTDKPEILLGGESFYGAVDTWGVVAETSFA